MWDYENADLVLFYLGVLPQKWIDCCSYLILCPPSVVDKKECLNLNVAQLMKATSNGKEAGDSFLPHTAITTRGSGGAIEK